MEKARPTSKQPTDVNELGHHVVQILTGSRARHDLPAVAKAVATGHAAGGHARAAKLTPERRSEIARKAAQARWNR